jgi:integrase
VFPGKVKGAPLNSLAMLGLLRRMARRLVAPHGLRATFRTWVNEATTFQRETAETALAHLIGDASERAYQRGDAFEKRRRLMEAWAKYVDTPRPAAGAVVPLRKR